ncbi:DUF3347 domain-containing protein [Flavitalea flava]
MKQIFFGLAITATFLTACNNTPTNDQDNKTTAPATDTTATATTSDVVGKKGSVKEILAGYLQMKNAFTKDDDKGAAEAGKVMVKAFSTFDTTRLTAEQSKIYKDVQDDAKEHAEHIGTNAGNIKHQREHFDMLSKDMHQLVKTFGAGQALYYDHCPMYNNNKGADWLSETKDIQNPYLGKAMPTCGSVKEELK